MEHKVCACSVFLGVNCGRFGSFNPNLGASLGRATQTESIVWVVDPNYLNKFDARNFVRFVVGHIDPVRECTGSGLVV